MLKIPNVLVACLLVLGLSGSALAVVVPEGPNIPTWWGISDPDRRGDSGTLTYKNTGTGTASGSLIAEVPNLEDPSKFKETYLVVEWSVDTGTGYLDQDVEINWPGHPTKESMVLEYVRVATPPEHWEYSYVIITQPAEENVYFNYAGIDPNETITVEWEVQTMCFDNPVSEPGSLGLIGLALLVGRKRRS